MLHISWLLRCFVTPCLHPWMKWLSLNVVNLLHSILICVLSAKTARHKIVMERNERNSHQNSPKMPIPLSNSACSVQMSTRFWAHKNSLNSWPNALQPFAVDFCHHNTNHFVPMEVMEEISVRSDGTAMGIALLRIRFQSCTWRLRFVSRLSRRGFWSRHNKSHTS